VRRGPRLKQLMENKSASQSVLICLFGVLTFAVCTLPALGQTCEPTTTWTGSTGDWFTDGNWDNHVPCSTTDAYINNGGGAQINAYAVAHSLTLGQYAGNSGTVYVTGTNHNLIVSSDVYVGYQGKGYLSITDGAYVQIPFQTHVGYQGTGTLSITNGATVLSVDDAYIGQSAGSNGSVTVAGSGSTWTIGESYALLFIGGTDLDQGGKALLSITDGGAVIVPYGVGYYAVKVGLSGTVTGNGTLDTTGSTPALTDVLGTLAPSGGTLSISGDLTLESSALTACNVTPQAADNVDISGTATLGGRLSVTMTGTFTCGTTYTLLTADGSRRETTFSSYSIKFPTGQNFSPQITYDTNHVYLYLACNTGP
jgi:T5SS/PEP-CTERM-associated repeat protein